MKLVIVEPLGVDSDDILSLAQNIIPDVDIAYYDNRVEDDDAIIERIKDADFIAVTNINISAKVIRACENLKLIAVAFSAFDHIDVDCCNELGITVCNCAGYLNASVTDLVFGLAISLYRNIIPCDKAIRNGFTRDGFVGFELENKKFGVIGTGTVGSRVATVAKAFGCSVYAYSLVSRYDIDVQYLPLDELLSTCDIISIHVPLDDTTRGLISAEKIAMMKRSAILINTSRGTIVDNTALANALHSGAIAGAGIDVFETEPPIDPDHPLLHTPNTILTPHIGFASKESLRKRAAIEFSNIRKYIDGNPENVVN